MHRQASKRCDGVTLSSHSTSHRDYKQTLSLRIPSSRLWSAPRFLDFYTVLEQMEASRSRLKGRLQRKQRINGTFRKMWFWSPLEMLEVFREIHRGTRCSSKKERRITYARFRASAEAWFKSSLFWDVALRGLVIGYRRFRTKNWSHFQGSRRPRRMLKRSGCMNI
jgi:hypothetical protein